MRRFQRRMFKKLTFAQMFLQGALSIIITLLMIGCINFHARWYVSAICAFVAADLLCTVRSGPVIRPGAILKFLFMRYLYGRAGPPGPQLGGQQKSGRPGL